MTVAPSLLSCDFLNIELELDRLKNFENLWLHLDVMDGHFVPNLTFGHPIIELLSKKTKIKLDAHLMVTNPQFYIDTFKNFSIHNFTIHFESQNECLSLIKSAKQFYPSVGLSLRPKTDIHLVPKEVLKEIDLLLVMSVEPGFSGQKFIETTYQKVQQAVQLKKSIGAHFQIQVDGGVSDKNIAELKKCGATNFVAGSYFFKDGPQSYQQKYHSLLQ